MIEFVVAILFLLVFTILTFACFWICFQTVTLQWMSTTSVRRIALGEPAAESKASLITQASRFGIALLDENIRICPTAVLDCPAGAAIDTAPGGLMFLRVEKRIDIPFYRRLGGSTIDIRTTAVGKIEP